MKMFNETYYEDNYYLCKVACLPTLKPATILEMVNFIWCSRSLLNDPTSLKSILTILNVCGLPANQTDYKQHDIMENRLSNTYMEKYTGQHF